MSELIVGDDELNYFEYLGIEYLSDYLVKNLKAYIRSPNQTDLCRRSLKAYKHMRNVSGIRITEINDDDNDNDDSNLLLYDWKKSIFALFERNGTLFLPPIIGLMSEPDDWETPNLGSLDPDDFEIDFHIWYAHRGLEALFNYYKI